MKSNSQDCVQRLFENIMTNGVIKGVVNIVKEYAEEGKRELSRKIRMLEPGDVVAVSRSDIYQHFAVYIGNASVIHFACPDDNLLREPTIHEAPFSVFLGESKTFDILEFDKYRREPRIGSKEKKSQIDSFHLTYIEDMIEEEECGRDLAYHLYTPSETVERAKEIAELYKKHTEYSDMKRNGLVYHLLENNCEHFAIFCKTGVHESKQVDSILKNVKPYKLRKYNNL